MQVIAGYFQILKMDRCRKENKETETNSRSDKLTHLIKFKTDSKFQKKFIPLSLL